MNDMQVDYTGPQGASTWQDAPLIEPGQISLPTPSWELTPVPGSPGYSTTYPVSAWWKIIPEETGQIIFSKARSYHETNQYSDNSSQQGVYVYNSAFQSQGSDPMLTAGETYYVRVTSWDPARQSAYWPEGYGTGHHFYAPSRFYLVLSVGELRVATKAWPQTPQFVVPEDFDLFHYMEEPMITPLDDEGERALVTWYTEHSQWSSGVGYTEHEVWLRARVVYRNRMGPIQAVRKFGGVDYLLWFNFWDQSRVRLASDLVLTQCQLFEDDSPFGIYDFYTLLRVNADDTVSIVDTVQEDAAPDGSGKTNPTEMCKYEEGSGIVRTLGDPTMFRVVRVVDDQITFSAPSWLEAGATLPTGNQEVIWTDGYANPLVFDGQTGYLEGTGRQPYDDDFHVTFTVENDVFTFSPYHRWAGLDNRWPWNESRETYGSGVALVAPGLIGTSNCVMALDGLQQATATAHPAIERDYWWWSVGFANGVGLMYREGSYWGMELAYDYFGETKYALQDIWVDTGPYAHCQYWGSGWVKVEGTPAGWWVLVEAWMYPSRDWDVDGLMAVFVPFPEIEEAPGDYRRRFW